MNPTHEEKQGFATSGYWAVLVCVAALVFVGFTVITSTALSAVSIGASIIVLIVAAGGLYMLQPNEAAALQLFGSYVGTDRSSGLRWTIPFSTRRRVSLRVRTFMCDKLKVNDQRGNPVEIAAAIVWRVEDTAKALFDVDSYETFVRIQSETALRQLATAHPYDTLEAEDVPTERTLRGGSEMIARTLAEQLNERLAAVGLAVSETKLTHLAYAPEIASAMLRRQQAEAVIAARRKIVDGAVGMVAMALSSLAEREVVHLDDERKASMVSNLLVVLCSDREVAPVVNCGTLYN